MKVEEFYKEYFGVDPVPKHGIMNENALSFAQAYAEYYHREMEKADCPNCGEHVETVSMGRMCGACYYEM